MRDDGIAYILSSASAQPSGRYLRPSCAPVSGRRMFCQVSWLGRVSRILQADATQRLRKSPQAWLCMMAKRRRQVVVNREIYLPSSSLHEEQRGESSKKKLPHASASHQTPFLFLYQKWNHYQRRTSRFCDVKVGGVTLEFRATGWEPFPDERWCRPERERDAY